MTTLNEANSLFDRDGSFLFLIVKKRIQIAVENLRKASLNRYIPGSFWHSLLKRG